MIKPPCPGSPDGAPMMDCLAAVNKLWDYLDGNLNETDRDAVRRHVQDCSHCFPHEQFGQVVLDAVAQVRLVTTDAPSLRDRVISRLRAEGYDDP